MGAKLYIFQGSSVLCKWVDNKTGVKVDEHSFTLVDLNKEGDSSDQFIMANQAKQVMQTKELDMLIMHMGMEPNLHKTIYHFLVAQLQDLEPNISRKH